MTLEKRCQFVIINLIGVVCGVVIIALAPDLDSYLLGILGVIALGLNAFFGLGNTLTMLRQLKGVPGADQEFFGDCH